MKCILLSVFLLLITPYIIHAQSAELQQLDSLGGRVIKGLQANNKNKIWLVSDRDIYAAGETIYCKAWLVDSIRNHIIRSPKKLYIDLINEKDSVVQHTLINNGALQTNSSLSISEALPGGNYWLRAYAFYKAGTKNNIMSVLPLYIISLRQPDTLQSVIKTEAVKTATTPSVTLFPEGGSIVSGLSSTIAVKAVDKEGKPWIISGTLKDNRDTVEVRFSTNREGLSKFTFYPKWFNTYTLHLDKDNGQDSLLATLPHINFFAGQLSVEKQTGNYLVARVALEDSIYKRNALTYLLGISGDSLCFAATGTGNYDASISTESFPGGVARLLLFNEKEKLLSERDVYISKKDADITLAADKNNYAGRENIQLSIEVRDAQHQPLLSSLAVSVTDSRIEDTTAVFLNNDTLASLSPEEADLILLTTAKKPATINLNSSLDNKQEVDEDSSFTISGRVLNAKGEPVSKRVVTLLANKKMFVLQTDTVSASGRFHFVLPELIDSTSFSAQVSTLRSRRDEESRIVFDTAVQPKIATPSALKKKLIQPVALRTTRNSFFNSSGFLAGMGKDYLKPVIVTTYKKKELTYDASKRVSNFSHIITQDQIGAGVDMAGSALLMVPRVHLSQGFVMIGGPSAFGASAKNEPLIVLDGARVYLNATDSTTSSPVLNFLNSISFRTIDFIEVLTGAEAAIYGTEGGNGVILINTKSGGGNVVTTPGLQSFSSKGFQEAKSFPMPDYSLASIRKSKVPDARVTLYWNGNLYTDKEGKAMVHFFSGDVATNYTVLITAVTANGCVVQKKFHISRK